jgi:hypothetical protein
MQQLDHPINFFRSVKGAPLSVLCVLLCTGRAMTRLELQEWTGYSGDSLTEATRLLGGLGWISARTARGPWSLMEGRQLPLAGALEHEAGNLGLLSSSSSSSIVESSANREEKEQEKPEISVLRRLMRECGIQEPSASRLIQLPHVTPELVRTHVRLAAAEGHAIGTAIYRIRHNWPVPAARSADHRSAEVEEKIRRFKEGR